MKAHLSIKAFQRGDVCLAARENKRDDSWYCRVSSVCVVYVILVIHRLYPSAGSYPIQQLHSKDPTQLYQGRILLSANVRGRKINACLSCPLSHDWSRQRGVCFSTKTLIHGAGWEFYAVGCLVNRFLLTLPVCDALNGLFLWARGNIVIPTRSQSQKKKKEEASLSGRYEWITLWGIEKKALQVGVTAEMLYAQCWLELRLCESSPFDN